MNTVEACGDRPPSCNGTPRAGSFTLGAALGRCAPGAPFETALENCAPGVPFRAALESCAPGAVLGTAPPKLHSGTACPELRAVRNGVNAVEANPTDDG